MLFRQKILISFSFQIKVLSFVEAINCCHWKYNDAYVLILFGTLPIGYSILNNPRLIDKRKFAIPYHLSSERCARCDGAIKPRGCVRMPWVLRRSFSHQHRCTVSVFSKGQCETVAYRFLGKRGGYAWVVTQATLIHCSKQQKPISVVCVNYILR